MKLIILFLISFNLLAQSVNPNNTLKIGDGTGSTVDKGLVFDTGDGVNNKVLKVDDTGKLKFSGNEAQLGDGTTGNDKCLILDSAAGSKVCWDGSEQKLIFNNGNSSTDKKFGSGSGGGGGENFNNGFGPDDNANAEDGTTGWTASAGTFAVTTTDPLEGDQSFTWTPAAQNDTLKSAELDFDKDIFKGRSCQASIEYIGGDENLTLKVLNGDDDELGSLALTAHTSSAPESVFFLCPSDADITGDADKGDLYLQIENTGASASALIKWDKSYLGTLIGLSESSLPDVLSFNISSAGVVSNDDFNIIDGDCIVSGTSVYTCTFTSGLFSVVPNINLTGVGDATFVAMQSQPTTSTFIYVTRNGSNALTTRDVHAIIRKQGADAKQSVQVYKSIPKVAENINDFSAKISGGGVVSDENTDWINGNCVTSDTSLQTCTFSASLFSDSPNCTVAVNSGVAANDLTALVSSTSSSSIAIRTMNNTAKSAQSFILKCQKNDTDYKMPTVQPVIVGQVVNSAAESNSKNVRVESCQVNNAGTPETANSMCDSWVSSISDGGVGIIDVNIEAGIFSDPPVCSCVSAGNTNCAIRATASISNTLIPIRTRAAGGNTLQDNDFFIVCQGRK